MNSNKHKLKDCVVVIPAMNEEQSIALVINDLPKARLLAIIVVDNGSIDQTANIARQQGATVISETKKGYGQACLTGIEYALKFNPENIIFVDADYSDFPQEMNLLLDKLDNGFDLVIGNRLSGQAEKGALLPQAIFGNWLATRLTHWLFGGKPFNDLGPFRGIK
ncbi:MAG: glycosyltransferase family 2 protein [Methylococcales bacterium]|nr:glycosyltransferase family 2 protein [Methylococcales bacterium]